MQGAGLNTLAVWLGLMCLGCSVPGTLSANKVQRIPSRQCLRQGYNDTIYEHSATEFWGNRDISLSEYAGKQEPGANATEIMNGINYVRPGNGFRPNFQMFAKIDVNGEKEHPLFTYLKLHCPTTRDGFASKDNLFYEPFKNWDVRWNWEKFLIDRSGRPVTRYDASTHPNTLTNDIERLVSL